MAEKRPLAERNSCEIKLYIFDWNLQLSSIQIDTFERKQHCNVTCPISGQGTFIILL